MADLILSLDVESRSAADLKKTGAYRYFEDASADILCAAFALGDGPVQVWRRGEPPPSLWQDHVLGGGLVSAHNAAFEHWALKLVLGPKYGWAVPAISQMRDTMAQCAAMSIPQSLDGAAKAMGLEQQKDKDGQRLIRKFCIPRKARNGEKPWGTYFNRPEDDPADFQKLCMYCAQDVEVERALRNLLVPLSEAEQAVWELTIQMNDRGVMLDLPLVKAMLKITDEAKASLDAALARATGWEVLACSQVSQLTSWLQRNGVPADKLNKNAIEDLLSSDLPEEARRAVEIRKEAAKTSTAKLTAMVNCASLDGRVRGLHLYHGAGTGRWSGRLVQTQNMPRGTGTVKDPEAARADFLRGSADWIEITYGRPMSAVSDMLRSCLVASPGHRLLAADYSSIEGRVTAWVAGEHDELAAYRAVDAGAGAGIYEIAAGGIFNVDPFNVSKQQRQVGKAACIAEGQQVLTLSGLVAIQNLQWWHILWDGQDWVRHGGVVYKGERDVWEYDGLVATEDHIVFTADGRNLPFGVCAREQIPLAKTGSGRAPIRLGESHRSGNPLAGYAGQARPQGWLAGSACSMHQLRDREVDRARQLVVGQDEGLPVLYQAARCAEMAGASDERGQVAMPVPGNAGVRELWWPRDRVSVRFADSRSALGDGKLGAAQTPGDRPSGQQRPLRAGEPAVCHTGAAVAEHAPLEGTRDAELAESVLADDDGASSSGRVRRGRDHGDGGLGSRGAPEKLARYRGKARVYDIVNAGPRHRFTVSGVLVHNCLALGFGGGVLAFNSMANIYGIDMAPVFPILQETTDAEVLGRAAERYEECLDRGDTGTDVLTREAWIASEVTKVLWRNKHPATVALWRGLQDAARDAVQRPGEIVTYACISYLVRRGFLWCRLPSGRCLAYGAPKVQERETPWGTTSESVTALGVNSVTKKWERFALYGGLLTENVVQAIARDLMAHGMLKAERAGYPIVMTVHDEAVADVHLGQGSLEGFEACLCDLPGWAEGLPLVASGYEAMAYKKD